MATQYKTITVTPLGYFVGAEVSGVDIAEGLSEQQFLEVRQAFVLAMALGRWRWRLRWQLTRAHRTFHKKMILLLPPPKAAETFFTANA